MPLSLSDDEYAAVQAAAGPIHRLHRGAFLKALAVELEHHPVIGPGLVHHLPAELQRRFGVEAHSERRTPWSRDTSGRAEAARSQRRTTRWRILFAQLLDEVRCATTDFICRGLDCARPQARGRSREEFVDLVSRQNILDDEKVAECFEKGKTGISGNFRAGGSVKGH
jgi:hypothetical protein